MIILAINSMQTKRLRNISAGAQELSTGKQNVKVREVDHGKLTFLVGYGVEGSVCLRRRRRQTIGRKWVLSGKAPDAI